MAAPKRTPCVWQHPFVDVFKTFSVDSAERRGDIAEEIDKQIGKRVYRIRGQISANSFLQFPGQSTSIRTLGLTGQYVYLQIKALGTKYFLVHFDLTVQSAHLFRISLSNMYTQVKTTYHAAQFPCSVQSRWTVVRVHLPAVLASCSRLPPHAFALKGVQLCASLYVRNLYTSDIRYTPSSLPREMLFDNQGSFEERFAWIELPGGEAGNEGEGLPGAGLDDAPVGSGGNPTNGVAETPPAGGQGQDGRVLGGCEVENGLGRLKPALLAEPLLRVRRLIGVSKRSRRLPDFAESIPRSLAVPVRCAGPSPGPGVIAGDGAHGGSRVLVASSMTLKLVDPMTHEERCFFGHTEPVELLEASADGLWAASVQGRSEASGAAPLLRLWRCGGAAGGPCGGLRCVSQLSCPGLAAVRTAAFGPGAGLLALAGMDMRGRQQLLV